MVQNGQKANETTFNDAFLSRTDDSDTVGVVGLNNTSDPNSGNAIVNTQRAINKLFDSDGTTGESDANAKLYSSNNYVVDGDSRKQAIERLDLAIGQKMTAPLATTPDGVTVFRDGSGVIFESTGVTVDISDNMIIPGDLTVQGDLTVNGTTTTVNSATLDVTDANVTVNVSGNDATAEGAGLTVERTSTHGSIVFDSSMTSKWKAGLVGSEVEIADLSSAQNFTNKTINDALIFNQIATPSNPSASHNKLYFKSDDKLYKLTSAGTETEVGGSGANTALSNLTTTSINQNLNPSSSSILIGDTTPFGSVTTNTVNVGSTGTAGTINIKNASNNNRGVFTADSGGYGIQFEAKSALDLGLTTESINAPFLLGGITLKTGNNANASGASGGVTLETGTAGVGLRGKIKFKDGSEGTAGHVWTSSDTLGNGYWAAAPASSTFKVEYRTISAGEATAKQITLVNTPVTAGEVCLDVIGVGPQFYGDDFTVSGTTLTWNGLGLDGILANGDKIRVTYSY